MTANPHAGLWQAVLQVSAQAKAEWKRIMPQLISRRIITKADLGGLESYCAAAGSARQIAEALAATGTLPDPKLAGVQIRFATLARQLASEYGLTPTARARLGNAAGDDDSDDPLAV